jgi:hypothetical protein
MAGFNYLRAQKIVDRQIQRFGGGSQKMSLRRALVDRPCTGVILQFTNAERQGSMIQFTDQRVLLSTVGLDTPPDNELDTLIHNDVEYAIIQPATPLAPDGETVLYWDLAVRK